MIVSGINLVKQLTLIQSFTPIDFVFASRMNFNCDQYDNQFGLSLDLIVDQASMLSPLQRVKNEADLMSAISFPQK